MSGPALPARVLVCGCGDRPTHCDPECEACRIHGMNRVHPRRGYNDGAPALTVQFGSRLER